MKQYKIAESTEGNITCRKLNVLFLVIITVIGITSCHGKHQQVQPEPAFTKYISSFTAGEVSIEAPVTVQLTEIPTGIKSGEILPAGLFSLQPSVDGEAVMAPGGIIQFRPSLPLSPGTVYTVSFLLDKLMQVDNPFRKFRFTFSTIATDFSVTDEGLVADETLNSGVMAYSGVILTSDVADPSLVEQIIKIKYDGRNVALSWSHSPDRRHHTFLADSLIRHESEDTQLEVAWDGRPVKVKNKGDMTIKVPARNDFKILSVKPQVSPEQQIILVFSDPLETEQPVEGMVEIENSDHFTWQKDGNRLILWPEEKISGECKITVFKGFRSNEGRLLRETEVFPLFFRNLKPEIRFLGKGVIVPDQGTLSLPFEAVSLKAVDLRIIRIYSSNIQQFLQDNQVDGGDEIKKVGRLAFSGKVSLTPDDPEKLHKWNTYRIDLNKYIIPEQGAVYRVELRFCRAYSLYDCQETVPSVEPEETEQEAGDWDSPGWYSLYYWPKDYDWKQKDNPCHNSYYTSERFVSRNILASNLGILAKEGKGFQFTFVVTNLKTAQPEEKVEISLYDFQHQLIGRTTTDSKGFATLSLSKKPFVAIAKKENQTGYLRIDDGSSLSLSNFDVSGEVVQEGVKGFLYGERGIWRPGDQLHLTFILDDPGKRLPENTPVIFRLVNSRGQEVVRRVETLSENGFYQFPVATRSDDPTGNWYAKVQVGGATFEQRIKIETVKPNRLKIDLKLPDPVKAEIKQTAFLNAVWLHGATAPFLKAVVETEFFPVKTVFKGYEKFTFDNPGVVFSPTRQTIFEGRLDQNGDAVIPLDFPGMLNAPGKLKAWFTTRVFEEGGDFSIHVREAEFSPFSKYIGLRMPDEEDGWYQTGKTYQPELVALSAEGRPVPLGKVDVSLYKVDWRWWWESGEDYLAHYVSGREFQPVKTWSLNSVTSAGIPVEKIDLNVEYHDWRDNGRYLLYARDPVSGHGTGVTFYMSEWGGWRTDAMPEGATILSLRTDKDKYSPGEKIRVSMPSSPSGRALVSLEDGKQVKDIFWVKTTENETTFDVDVKPGMAPTLYIYVTLIQPYGSTMNDAPIRLYGVEAVTVEDPETVLNPGIRMNEELEPEKDFSVKVTEQKGKAMTYTLAIVDEGLLDITNFKTPDPHGHFYAREALGVKTYDLFDYVAGAYGAQLEKAFAIGGDQDIRVAGQKQANRFQPVVLFAGPFTIPKNGSKTHTFKMPNYVGSVKAMVIAGNNGAYGNCDKTAKVRKAVMLLATLPRVAGPGEELSLPVSVFAMKETTREVTIRIETNDMVVPAGEKVQKLMFTQPGEKMAWFNVKTAGKTGIAKIKMIATSGSETSTYETELDVRNPNPPVTTEENRLLEPGQKWSPAVTVPGMAGTNHAFLELAAIPGLNLSRHLDDLIQYPHGCAEQTVSAGFCQLYLENLVQLTPAEKMRAEENIKGTIQRLQGLQTSTGGFAYWPGQNASDDWCSGYAGHFLILAAQKGYSVPGEMKNRWLSFQITRARQWRPATAGDPFTQRQEALIQAYRLYTLALAGSPERGVMNRFREDVSGFAQARWRLAAAFLLAGQTGAADMLIQQSQITTEEYPGQGATFGSELRDKAMILETLILKNDRKRAFSLLKEMAGEINDSQWLSTQTAAWCFCSISEFFGMKDYSGGIDAQVTLTGKQEKQRSELPMIKIPLEVSSDGKAGATVENTGTSPLFVRVSARGIPLEDTYGGARNDLSISSVFTDRNGKSIDPSSLLQGTDLFLNVTVSHPGTRAPYRDLVLSTIFPSGWEILNSRINDIPENQSRQFDYQDIRDDRIYTYFSLKNSESKTFRISLNASYGGKFYLPAQVCEEMYDNSVYARIPGQWVKVVKP